MEMPPRPGERFGRADQEALAILMAKDIPPLAAAGHHVVNRSGVLEANRPSHCPVSLFLIDRLSQANRHCSENCPRRFSSASNASHGGCSKRLH